MGQDWERERGQEDEEVAEGGRQAGHQRPEFGWKKHLSN